MLNANYLKALLAEPGIAEYLPIAFDRTCMHEFVLSGPGAKEKLGIRTLDIAKRMLDHDVHPPTVYFPLLVDEALMIEPTETETKERLDHFAEVVRAILEEAKEDPEVARTAPHTTPVRRLDEAGAAKRPVVRWRPVAENPGDPSAHRRPRRRARARCRRGCDRRSSPRCTRGSGAEHAHLLPLPRLRRPVAGLRIRPGRLACARHAIGLLSVILGLTDFDGGVFQG